MTSPGRPQAAVLALLALVLCCGGMLQPVLGQPPSCTLIPGTTLLGGTITIPVSGDVKFLLNPGTYTLLDTNSGTPYITGRTICLVGTGTTRDSVVIKQGIVIGPHIILGDSAVLHLEQVTLDGGDTGGGVQADGNAGVANKRKLTTNTVLFQKISGSAIFASLKTIEATIHNTAFRANTATSNAGAVNLYMDSPATASLTFSGNLTEFSNNQAMAQAYGGTGGAFWWGTGGDFTNNKAALISATFLGDVLFSGNKARAGGAMWLEGGVSVKFQGANTKFLNNLAVGGGGNGVNINDWRASGGAIFITKGSQATAPLALVEFSSTALTLFQGNQATPATGVINNQAEGGAILFYAATGAGTELQVVFKNGPARFENNSASPQVDPNLGGGAVDMSSETDASSTMVIESCVSFENNVIPVTGSTSNLGAAIALEGSGSGQSKVTVTTPGRLIFGRNTISGVAVEQDVRVGPGGSIVCPTSIKTNGTYAVSCDICGRGCGSIGFVTCNTCATTPATCPADCNFPPTNVSNSQGWSCPALPVLFGSTCNATCASGYDGSATAICLTTSYSVTGACTPATCKSQPSANVTNAAGWSCALPAQHNTTCNTTCNPGLIGSPVATCSFGQFSVTGSCTGCPAPPPTGGGTLITGFTCSATPSSAGYAVGTACTATCTSGSSGGFAVCRVGQTGLPAWQVTACTAGCTGNPGAVADANPWQCGSATISGIACSTTCAAGFSGGPVTSLCLGGSWSNTTGTCTRSACIGSPAPNPPNATFLCASTPVGAPCVAVCISGLTGGPSQTCLANGTWGPLQGDPCENCAANTPKLAVVSPPGSFPEGTTAVTAMFSFTARLITGTTFAATLDGDLALPCSVTPAQLPGPAGQGATIAVSCQRATPLSNGPHSIALTAKFTGSNGCPSGSVTELAPASVVASAIPAPTVKLSADPSLPPVCKPATAGATASVSATFSYQVTPGAGATGGLTLGTSAASAAGGVTCTAERSGLLEAGTLTTTCTGVLDALTSLSITATLTATTPGSLVGQATSSGVVSLVCCSANATTGTGPYAHALNDGASSCLACGTTTTVDGVLYQEMLTSGVMCFGTLSPATCAGGPSVGSITTSCDQTKPKVLRVTVTNPAGSTPSIQFLTRCNVPTKPSQPCGGSGWKTPTATTNNLVISSTAAGTTYEFAVQHSLTTNCVCGTFYWAVRQSGSFALGPPSGGGACPTTATAKRNRRGGGGRL